MTVTEFFEQMESEYRSATPWPWPKSMTLDQLDWFRITWHGFEPMHGVYLSDGIRVTGRERGKVKTLIAGWDYSYAESISHKPGPWRQGDCWAIKNGCVVKIR